MNNKLYIIILIFSSFFIHFIFFGNPSEVVFDEVWYGRHVNDYINQTFHFDGHPPLGRMTIAGFAKLAGYEPESSFENISDKYSDKQYLILRFLPTLAGAILPIIVYLIILELGMAPLVAFAGGMLITMENGFVAQSRLLLMDSSLLLYEFTSLFFYLRYRNHKKLYMLFLSGIFGALAFSVKWVGLSAVAFPILFEGLNIMSEMWNKGFAVLKSSKTWLTFTALIITPFIVYFSIVTAYSLILHKSGTGDAFMSPEYQKTLEGNQYNSRTDIKASNVFERFSELNREMYQVNQGLTASHPYSSQWYTWPFMTRPIYYWIGSTPSTDMPQADGNSRIYFIGNPVIWWLSTIALVMSFVYLLFNLRAGKPDKISALLLSGYILNLLPFIGVKRIMFLYHYLTAYIFAIIILAYLISQNKDSNGSTWLTTRNIFGVLLVASGIAFIFFSPLTYGLNLSSESYETRVWLDSWR